MGEEVAVEIEKRVKRKSKKSKKSEESSMGTNDAQNLGTMKAIEHVQRPKNEDIAQTKRHRKRDKEKKKNKRTKNAEQVEIEKTGVTEGELIGADGEDATTDAERNRRKREKHRNKNDGSGSEKCPVEAKKERKKQKAMKNFKNVDIKKVVEKEDGKEAGEHSENHEVNVMEVVEKKKRKREGSNVNVAEKTEKKKTREQNDEASLSAENIKGNVESNVHDGNVAEKTERKKKKREQNDEAYLSSENVEGKIESNEYEGHNIAMQDSIDNHINEAEHAYKEKKKKKKKKAKLVENVPDDSTPNESNKKVRFSGEDEVFILPDDDPDTETDHYNDPDTDMDPDDDDDNLVRGKRFTPEEDKIVKNAVLKYIDDHDLGEEGLEMILNCGKHPEVRGCWQEIGPAIPYRPYTAIQYRAQVLFRRSGHHDDPDTKTDHYGEDNLVRGKRFTPEEDEIVKDAVMKYIDDHDLGEEGLEMVLNCKKHRQVKGCWQEIGPAIPYRPYTAIYYRAQVLFRRSEHRKWTQEEYDEILRYQEEHGNQWKALADDLGKHRWHVKDTWRRIKLQNMNKGHWSQTEYKQLFDLVNYDLQLKINEEKKSKHGMLRDNICWTAISDKMSTRAQANCCVKWYKQLTSRMVAEGVWADTDDYRLIGALYSLDATCVDDVDWDGLIEHRSGDLCRKRWGQMVLHIGMHGNKSFGEQVDVLAQRYCPDLLEAREIWDSKPRVLP